MFRGANEGHGLVKPPRFRCHALALVTSSSGLVLATVGFAVIAYSTADVDPEDIARSGVRVESLDECLLAKRDLRKARMARKGLAHEWRSWC